MRVRFVHCRESLSSIDFLSGFSELAGSVWLPGRFGFSHRCDELFLTADARGAIASFQVRMEFDEQQALWDKQ